MSRTTMTMVELLARIRKTRSEVEQLFKEYIDQDTSTGRSMVTLANKYTGHTINGVPTKNVTDKIEAIDDDINAAIDNLEKLLIIKEQVNATSKITLVGIDGYEITMSVAQCLTMKSDQVRKYRVGYLEKLRKDYAQALELLALQQESVMANDKVDRYVIAKMNALNIKSESESYNATYAKFSEEYRTANVMDIVDPLHIRTKIDDKIKAAREFYDTLDIRLLEFNATTKIWIDLEAENGQIWGFAN